MLSISPPRLSLTLSFLLGLCTQLSHAHTAAPYLLPEQFDSKNNSVSLQSAITIEKFYSANRNYSTRFFSTTPDGIQQEIKPVANLERFSLLDLAIPQEGTYQIKTANQASSSIDYARIEGRWLRVRTERPATPSQPAMAAATPAQSRPTATSTVTTPEAARPRRFIYADEVPTNTPTAKTDVIQLAETYVTKGAPSTLPKPTGKGLELIPITHPNEVFADGSFEFKMQFDGKPLPKLTLELYRGASEYDEEQTQALGHIDTDDEGHAKIDFKNRTGIYLLFAQYPAASSDAVQQPPARLYNYGLTLQAAP